MAPLTTRQIVDAIHEGLPIPEEDDSKTSFAREFTRWHGDFGVIEDHPAFSAVREEHVCAMCECSQRAPSKGALIRFCTREAIRGLRVCCASYLQEKNIMEHARDDGKEYAAFKEEHWKRLQRIRPKATEGVMQSYPDVPASFHHNQLLTEIVRGGIGNVAFTTWALHVTALELFQKQHGWVPSDEDFRTMGASTLPLINDLTSSHDRVFNLGIMKRLRNRALLPPLPQGIQDPFHLPPFDSSAFTLNSLALSLHPDIVEPIREELFRLLKAGQIDLSEPRVGCVGRVMFAPIHTWCARDADRILLPYSEHILALPYEKECSPSSPPPSAT